MGVNLIPFPRLHFFAIAQTQLFAPADAKHVKVTAQEMTDHMWSPRNFLANVKQKMLNISVHHVVIVVI